MNNGDSIHYYHLLQQIQKIDYTLEDLLILLETKPNDDSTILQLDEYYKEKRRLVSLYDWYYDHY